MSLFILVLPSKIKEISLFSFQYKLHKNSEITAICRQKLDTTHDILQMILFTWIDIDKYKALSVHWHYR